MVFFKLMLIGFLENINSDRKIIEQASLRLDMLYFLGYDIDEPLPWHSTLSRTRKLFGEEVFLGFFRDILKKCVEAGMVDGKTQAVDSAFIKAHASLDSLVDRGLWENSKRYFRDITENEEKEPRQEQPQKNQSHTTRPKRNARYVSKTDPDARMSWKPGKAAALNHLGLISVDTKNHVICGAAVDFADQQDSASAKMIMGQTIENLKQYDVSVEKVLADAGFSNGNVYKYLEKQSITAYIPTHGGYKPQKEGFSYDEATDCYTCSQGVKLPYKNVLNNGEMTFKMYYASALDCRICPLKQQCCKNSKSRKLTSTIDKPYYDTAHKLMNTRQGKRMIQLRSATVEPVLGTLLTFRRMKKVYTIGQDLAHKQLLMAAATYNLKKLMNAMGFFRRGVMAAVGTVKSAFGGNFCMYGMIFSFSHAEF